MSTPYYPMPWAGSPPPHDAYDYRPLVNAAANGAMVGLAGAAAANLHKLQNHDTTTEQALGNTIKTALVTGTATAAASAVGGLFQRSSLLSVAIGLATGTAVMYALHGEDSTRSGEIEHE